MCSSKGLALCPDCGVEPDAAHMEGCDVALCLWTGDQRLSCDEGLDWVEEVDEWIAEGGRPQDLVWRAYPDHPRHPDGSLYREAFTRREPDHDCGAEIWTGTWPGEMECIEFGWFLKILADPAALGGERLVACDGSDPDAWPDLNRLHEEAAWDRAEARFVLRPQGTHS